MTVVFTDEAEDMVEVEKEFAVEEVELWDIWVVRNSR